MRILIVGCGQLGSRHLQAVASLVQVKEVEVVDLRLEGLQLGKDRLREISDCQSSISFRWLTNLNEVSRDVDLCVVATQAEGRFKLFQDIIKLINCKKFLFEKIVAQSVEEYEKLLALTSDVGLTVWVNCKTRAHPSHKRVKSKLEPSDPIIFTAVGGNHGLATNGVHAADLFAFYDESRQIEPGWRKIDPILHPSKRGKHLFDLSGTLQGYTAKGSIFTLSYAAHHTGPGYFTISSTRYRAVIDDQIKMLWESEEKSGWEWHQVSYDDNLAVSHLSKRFVSEILSHGQCELPTLEECYPAHRYILTELHSQFNALLGKEEAFCPVT